MKYTICSLIAFFLLNSCSKTECDCSYSNFKKLKKGMGIGEIQNILHSKPNKISEYGYCVFIGFEGDNNSIIMALDEGKLLYKSFNAPLYVTGHKIDLK